MPCLVWAKRSIASAMCTVPWSSTRIFAISTKTWRINCSTSSRADLVSQTVSIMRARLGALNPLRLDIVDESHKHRNHAGAKSSGGGHFQLEIVSAQFRGLSPMERHRLIYAALGDLMQQSIHALSIRALSPDENPI